MTKKKGRGPTGSVGGDAADEATETLVALVDATLPLAPEKRHAAAAAWLKDRGITHDQAGAYLWALKRIPGVRGTGQFLHYPAHVRTATRHRDWRISAGRLDLEDALRMIEALAVLPPNRITPTLSKLRDRLLTAVTPLLQQDQSEP